MRRLVAIAMATVVGVALSTASACGSDGEEVGGQCTALATGTADCEAPLDVATAADIEREVLKLQEFTDANTQHSGGAALRPTRDLRATVAIVLDIAPFRGTPANCPDADAGCSETWAFTGERSSPVRFGPGRPPTTALPANVSCTATTSAITPECEQITIAAGAVVRFQRAAEPYRFASSFAHFVRVVRPCTAACTAEEQRCAPSQTCIADAPAFQAHGALCVLCEARPETECACRRGCVRLADGAQCSLDVSDDLGTSGTCQAGTCK